MKLLNLLNPYAHVMRFRRVMYRAGLLKSYSVGVPVVSVGNITVGGTGKTPTVLLIAHYLIHYQGLRPGIVLRGYKRKSKGLVVVSNGQSVQVSVETSGDEAMLLTQSYPQAIVVVAEDRVEGARKAVELGAEVIILDDGYQHMRLKRDVNVLIVDAGEGLGNVIPFGRSREPMGAARDANAVLFTNAAASKKGAKTAKKLVRYLQPTAEVSSVIAHPIGLERISHRQNALMEPERFEGAKLLAVSGIANPRRFHITLSELGAQVMIHALPDHAEYSEHTALRALDEARRLQCDAVVITAKDAVKARDFFANIDSDIPVYILHIEFEFLQNERGFYAAVDRALKSQHA